MLLLKKLAGTCPNGRGSFVIWTKREQNKQLKRKVNNENENQFHLRRNLAAGQLVVGQWVKCGRDAQGKAGFTGVRADEIAGGHLDREDGHGTGANRFDGAVSAAGGGQRAGGEGL